MLDRRFTGHFCRRTRRFSRRKRQSFKAQASVEQIFNPYREWLGWDQSRAPDYYELLGISRGEADGGRIALAAEQRIAAVRRFRPGEQAPAWSQLLDEIRTAKTCLSDPTLRERYNARSVERRMFQSAARVGLAEEELSTKAVSAPAEVDDLVPGGAIDTLLPPVAEHADHVATREGESFGFAPVDARHADKFGNVAVWIGAAIACIGILSVVAALLAILPANQPGAGEGNTGPRVAVVERREAPVAIPRTETPRSEAEGVGSEGTENRGQGAGDGRQETGDRGQGSERVQAGVTPPAASQPFREILAEARGLLSEAKLAAAEEKIAQALQQAASDGEQAAANRYREAAAYVRRFHDALAAAVGKMQAGETFRVGGTTEVAFVEGGTDRVVLRVSGMNSTYFFADMPPGLALAIVDRALSPFDPGSRVVKGAYLAFHKQADVKVRDKAQALWEEAAAEGAEVEHLLPLLAEGQ
jgi:hypothetical protein